MKDHDEGDNEEEQGDREHDIDDAHQECVDPAAEESRDRPD